jgi:NAD(P)-dependent dehydrogenase (short-subunit alcohol dehydrogenase family)
VDGPGFLGIGAGYEPLMPPLPFFPRPRRGAPRVLVVTGASSGIGLALVQQAAAEGDHVVLVARDHDSLELAAKECERAGAASTMVVPTDVGDDEAVRLCVARVLDRHGRIDAFVNSAGVVTYGRAEEVPADVFEGVLRTNLLGSVNVARHMIPVLRSQGQGSLVLVGSVIGHIAAPGMTPYVVSKWGVRALARQLQLENRDIGGLHVSYVAPGGVGTPIYEQAGNYAGWAGRPPPPVVSPERVAKVIRDRLEDPRPRTQVGPANDIMRLGFSALPAVYDVLVGPLMKVAAFDATRPLVEHAGNVLASQPHLNRLRGDQATALVALPRNILTRLGALNGSVGQDR